MISVDIRYKGDVCMGKKGRLLNRLENKLFINMFVILILFIFANKIILKNINESLLNNMSERSIQNAKTHITGLSNTKFARKTINELLEDRIITACNTVLNHEGELSNEFLEHISQVHKVDHIYWLNFDAEVEYTANDYLGWRAKQSDEVYKFAKSDEKKLIEPIREDSVSGILIKYGQIRGKTGFVQVGVLADKIEELTDRFCMECFLDELANQEDILYTIYLDNQNEILYSTSQLTRTRAYAEELKAIENDEITSRFIKHKGMDVYETIYPVYIDNKKEGSLIIIYSLEDIKALRNNVTVIVSFLLISIYISYIIYNINIKKKNKEIEKMAYFDKGTGLYNENYFSGFIGEKIEKDRDSKKAILLVKYKNLQVIRSIYGKDNANEILNTKIKQLEDKLNPNNPIFKLGNDTLSIYVEDYEEEENLINIAKTLLESMVGIKVEEKEDILFKNIGIYEINKEIRKLEDIEKHLDILSSKLGEIKGDEVFFYGESEKKEILFDKKIEGELLEAHYRNFDEFYLEYQPQLNLKTNRIVGIEALARWNSKKLGQIPPGKFIAIAERIGSINHLGFWIKETALKFLKELEEKGIYDIKLAINISVYQLLEEDFVDKTWKLINDTGVNPKNLIFEITESVLIENHKFIDEKLSLFRQKGVSISLDDFGTGQSSLYRIKSLNIDFIKIDKSFIDHLVGNEDILINSILSIGKDLNLLVIAEGVEEETQKEYLKNKDCYAIQGYIFSKPVNKKEIIKLIENTNKGVDLVNETI